MRMEEAKASFIFCVPDPSPKLSVFPPPSMYNIDGNILILTLSQEQIPRANILYHEINL